MSPAIVDFVVQNNMPLVWDDLLNDDEELQLPSCTTSTSNSIRELINNGEFFNAEFWYLIRDIKLISCFMMIVLHYTGYGLHVQRISEHFKILIM
ncbi:hypothetical protein TSAR_016898 [Trichomalopsis sarcophagae]|uniref:Uncharacterized protein n=1 Tax=Trichomalopsis sarcophagae TaxID=543379 RepID=A0A232EE27_9HYME|nr:hypothetical protein TSAR_016898 [Trichomalopsis sarcophagae]